MSTTEPQVATPPFRPRWYQFTLREMLLAALAMCLLCGLFAGERHSSTTSFFDSFERTGAQGKVVAAACARASLKSHVLGGPSCGSGRETGAVYDCEVVLDSPPLAQSRKVVAALEQEIERLLREDGCEMRGRGGCSYDGFMLEYRKGPTEGDIYVHTLQATEGDPPKFWRLSILIHESVKYGPIGR